MPITGNMCINGVFDVYTSAGTHTLLKVDETQCFNLEGVVVSGTKAWNEVRVYCGDNQVMLVMPASAIAGMSGFTTTVSLPGPLTFCAGADLKIQTSNANQVEVLAIGYLTAAP